MHALRASIVVTSLLAVVGCVEPSVESTSEQGVTTSNRVLANRIASNRIASNRIASNRIASNRIASNRIASNRIASNAVTSSGLLDTEGGREVFEYLVGCALPEGEVIEATIEGVTYEFAGGIGLAPKWLDRGLTASERGWISACMIARVNDAGHALLISLRGPHRALDVTEAEAAAYTLEEGAFFGDIFAPADEPLVMLSCRGGAQIAGQTSGDLGLRGCARENPDAPGHSECWDAETGIGIDVVGDCPVACEERYGSNADAGYWERCHDATTTDPKEGWAGTARYDQVITVFVRH